LIADSPATPASGRGTGLRVIVVGAAGLTMVGFVLVAALTVLGGASFGAGTLPSETPSDGVSALAESEIPPLYLQLYEQAARHYGLDWAILAGIGKVECDHGRDPDPSCTHEGAVNSAGAGGPMQFLASTWATYGVDADGDGPPNRWDPADAIYAAANYLRASGAPSDYERALFSYNHASWYVAEVESWARKYGGAAAATSAPPSLASDVIEAGTEAPAGADLRLQSESPTAVRFIAGERAELDPGDGHLALVPAGVPASVQAMVVAGNELQDLPYGPGGHPDPLGAREEDCSSTVNYVLYRSGIRPLAEILKQNPLAQDYVSWGAPGPGRWVTIYASASPEPHVFMTIAGLRLDTSHNGTDVGPNRFENGPRWRILDEIPTWAHWSVRHPPGL
jgi:Transglycosylase SLT domain